MSQKKTLKQILELLPELIKDVSACEESLCVAEDKQPLRRSYIRSLFAMIEGTVHSIKVLEFAELYSRENPHIPTIVALKEKVFEIDVKGKIKEKDKFIQLTRNLRFTANVFHVTFSHQLDLGIGSSKWESFKAAIKIRNRITHPKDIADYNIDDKELSNIKQVNEWFNSIVKDIIEHVSEYYKG